VLGANGWIAVFSYGNGGTMFVDVYDERLGDKLLSTTLPVTVSPDKLFKGAVSIEGGYIMLRLNASCDAFAFRQLPAGL
jgi:hypothetical protein